MIDDQPTNSIEASVRNLDFEPRPCRPTTARPGTRNKLDILARRAAAGRDLWHNDDPSIIPSIGDKALGSNERLIYADPGGDMIPTAFL